ncbi:DUF305 domain-containing protein [Mycolicibacterium aichiense]|uniref:DUF305 domain-containing protein n=1 Tax=Mycolicibacterium aichiense TaxID=1799 RepID=A0AAD1MFG2_9MYCO|nr:DUF305 domain-containing protein [Mycolicibacterium aichiense]MCV7016983.1 DUF305 domain-containing protein [Mycolicibacterium aichiense]BBX10590.1 hypothetical protein MAIC_53930 [Mycolicibacterium aichiense]STZ25752.1 putative lipoprotein [Mycolicibacterium aichiense]
MTSTPTRIVAVAAAVSTAVVVSSCSKTEDHTQHAASTVPTSQAVAAHNADDVMFAQMMIPHHQQAVDLAAIAAVHTTNQAVRILAGKIADEQQPEIDQMNALLQQWDVDPATTDHSGHGAAMQGMVDDATMTKLKSLNGPQFDTLWLQAMIGHHQGAIEMAKAEIANGQSADLTAMAKSIVTAQQAEIDQMKQMLGG